MSTAGVIILFVASILSSSAGLGGGTLNVPILINLLGFNYHEATILSLCTIMGNYTLQVLVNLDRPHPLALESSIRYIKPLIFWEAVLIMSPAEVGGSNLGVILSSIVPPTVLYIIALFVLLIALFISVSKGITLRQSELSELCTRENTEEENLISNQSISKKKFVTVGDLLPPCLKCRFSGSNGGYSNLDDEEEDFEIVRYSFCIR